MALLMCGLEAHLLNIMFLSVSWLFSITWSHASPKSQITDTVIELILILIIIYSWSKTPYKSMLVYLTDRLRISGHCNLQSKSGLVWINVSWKYKRQCETKFKSTCLKSTCKFLSREKQIAGPNQLFVLFADTHLV